MKKLHITYLTVAICVILFSSCSYQNYTASEAHFSPLTGDMYASNSGWNADHYNVATKRTNITPRQTPVVRPLYSSIVMTGQ